MTDPQEAATPSDPHSAEAEARYPDPPPPTPWDYMSPPEEVRERERDAFIAGRVSRDAEVAELKAKIAGLEVWPAHDHVWDFNGRCLGCASWEKCPEFGSASSPVEGRPHDN